MKKIIKNRNLLLLFRVIIGLVFIVAGVEKIANPESFAVSIENYKILPVFIINIVAIPLPWIEFVAGLLLIFGVSVKENITIINLLLVIFIAIVLTALLRGLDIDCGCFGTLDGQKVGMRKVAENIILLAFGLFVYYFDKDPVRLKQS